MREEPFCAYDDGVVRPFARIPSIVLVVLVTVGTASASLAAGDSAKESAGEARAHFKQGRTHYQLGEYRKALDEFKAAYLLKQDASFLYNIAQCHRQLGELSDAVKMYASYLREAPEAANRTEVERQIRELKAAIEQQRQQEAQAAAAAPSPTAVPTGEASATLPTAVPAPPVPVPTVVPAPPVEVPKDAELEVIARPPEANILVNHISVGMHGPVKLRLPPGLYSVSLEREGFRGAEGAVTLIAGDHTAVAGDLTRVKTHGWRSLGTTFVVLGALAETGGIVGHILANRRFAGTDDFNRFATLEKIGQGVAIGSATLAITCYVLDWALNRGNVNPGPPSLLLPASRETP